MATISAAAPPGGCITDNNRIAIIDNDTASAAFTHKIVLIVEINTPIIDATKKPPITFLGCANGDSGQSNTITALAPKASINIMHSTPPVVKVLV